MERRQAPNLGQCIAPGGKLRPGESPHECVIREVREETGLAIRAPRLRAVITQTAADPDERWMLFVHFMHEFRGRPRNSCREGRLFWCPIRKLLGGKVEIPDADRIFTPWLFERGRGVIVAKFWHRRDLSVARYERYQ